MGSVFYDRVKDPTRLRPGDLVILPKGEKRLELGPGSWGKVGVSMGGTRRSANRTDTVKTWLCKKPDEARVFLVAEEYSPQLMRLGDRSRLLGLDAVNVSPTEGYPKTRDATVVPFGVPLWATGNGVEWTRADWRGAWNGVTNNSVAKRLADRPGAVACVPRWNSHNPENRDRYAKTAVDAYIDHCNNPPVPMLPGGPDSKPDAVSFTQTAGLLPKLVSLTKRITLNRKAIYNMAERGMVVLRPTRRFVDHVTTEVYKDACGVIASEYENRTRIIRDFMAGLDSDMKLNCESAAACRRSAKSTCKDRSAADAERRLQDVV